MSDTPDNVKVWFWPLGNDDQPEAVGQGRREELIDFWMAKAGKSTYRARVNMTAEIIYLPVKCCSCDEPATCWFPLDKALVPYPYCEICAQRARDSVLRAMDGAW